MKRLLLAPLLLGLLISNSALAGRPDPKKKLAKQQQEEYISVCNNPKKGNFSICNKIYKSNRNRITNQKFLDTKKADAQKFLNRCIKYNEGFVCSELKFSDFKILEGWIEVKPNQKKIVEFYHNTYIKKITTEKHTKPSKLSLLQDCDDLIKAFLKDPNSYQRINSRYMQEATGIIEYTATNSFGGRVRESYKCFNP